MKTFFIVVAFAVILTVSLAGFRGCTFDRPPIEVFPDMDRQPKVQAQAPSPFFEDGRGDRPPVPGTIPTVPEAQRPYYDESEYYGPSVYFSTGRESYGGDYGTGIPVAVTSELLELGQAKFQIFCQVCHGETGNGQGPVYAVAQSNPLYNVIIASFHQDAIRGRLDGHIFDTITNGRNLMGAYGYNLSPRETWAIVAYVRALQRSQMASPEDVPTARRQEFGL